MAERTLLPLSLSFGLSLSLCLSVGSFGRGGVTLEEPLFGVPFSLCAHLFTLSQK